MVWLGLYPKPVLSRMEAASKRYVELTQPGRDRYSAPREEIRAERDR